jgi:alpha/beta superfamily hydrolase
LKDLLRNPAGNVLVIFGDQDEFTGISRYDAWVKELGREGGPLKVVSIHDATHFWTGKGRELQGVVEGWLTSFDSK